MGQLSYKVIGKGEQWQVRHEVPNMYTRQRSRANCSFSCNAAGARDHSYCPREPGWYIAVKIPSLSRYARYLKSPR
jgi:hypothetical protein